MKSLPFSYTQIRCFPLWLWSGRGLIHPPTTSSIPPVSPLHLRWPPARLAPERILSSSRSQYRSFVWSFLLWERRYRHKEQSRRRSGSAKVWRSLARWINVEIDWVILVSIRYTYREAQGMHKKDTVRNEPTILKAVQDRGKAKKPESRFLERFPDLCLFHCFDLHHPVVVNSLLHNFLFFVAKPKDFGRWAIDKEKKDHHT